MSKVYDVIVLGAGPAGLAAGLYAGRSRLSTLVIEKGKDGGQIATQMTRKLSWTDRRRGKRSFSYRKNDTAV